MFALRRLVSLVVGIILLVIGSFMIVQLIPGDPARRIAGADATPEYVAALRERMGLDDSLFEQFVNYLHGVVTLDFGNSFQSNQDVGTIIADRLPMTALLAATSLVAVLVLGLGGGIAAAAMTEGGRRTRLRSVFLFVTGAFTATPEFLLGAFLVFALAVQIPLLPVAGAGSYAALVLPTLAIALPNAAMLSRVVRVQALEILRSDYVRTARSKRLPNRIVYLRHVLPNVTTAALTLGSVMFIALLGGSVVVENIFSWPGLGTAIVDAIVTGDYPLIQGVILTLGVIVLVVNVGLEVLLGVLDPRRTVREI